MWSIIVPVKRLAVAKTRLRGAVPGVKHDDLVLAVALDTVAAAIAAPSVTRVLVITDEPSARAAAQALGAEWIDDQPDQGLNPALTHGAATARALDAHTAVAALSADLPALSTAELDAALCEGPATGAFFVPDLAGEGTVLLAAPSGVPFAPAFGAGSAQAHEQRGALRLRGDWPSLRRDVDTPGDLAAAQTLGLGPRTAALLLSTPPQDHPSG